MTKPLIYVAGAITHGNQAINVRTALQHAEKIISVGAHVYVPHLSWFWEFLSPKPYEFWMDQGFAMIKRCDGLYRIDNYSPGALREEKFAKEQGLPTYGEWDFDKMTKWIKAWENIEAGDYSEQ